MEEEINVERENINVGGEGLSTEVKNAILDCFEHVAWTDEHGQDYYDALEELFFPPKTLVSINAVFSQGSAVIYSTDTLDSLKQYLTVTATYDDSTTETITNYSLNGTLSVGTSTITVSYGGKTDTFTVIVSQPVELSSISAAYTQSGTVYTTDTLDSLKNDLVVTANYTDSSTRTVTDYTLSGNLTAGTSTITVSYGGKTTTFNVAVSTAIENLFNADTAPDVNYNINTSTNRIISPGGIAYWGTYIPIVGGKTYKITKNATNAFRYATTSVEPAIDVTVLQTEANHTGTEMTFTADSNAQYLYFNYGYTEGSYTATVKQTTRNSIVVSEV